MKLLQRYILAELIRVFSLLVVVLTVMLVFAGVFREASERGLGLVQIVQIVPYVVPSMLPFTVPATLLLAVCVVYGRISGDLEVTAAKAAGISAMQLLAPAFLLGSVLTVGSFGLTNFAIPWAVGNIERIVTQAMEDIFLDMLATQNLFSDAAHGYTINVAEVRDRILVDATFVYRQKDHQQITVRAKEASIRFDLEQQELRLRLKDWTLSRPGADTSGQFDEYELALPLRQGAERVKARHLTIGRLEEEIAAAIHVAETSRQLMLQEATMLLVTGDFAALRGTGLSEYTVAQRRAVSNERRYRAEVHNRFAMAASCLFFSFLGGPFSMLQARRQFITSFIMCFLPILLIYYPTTFLMVNLCKTGTVQPWWSMWVPNAILGCAGWVVLQRVIRH